MKFRIVILLASLCASCCAQESIVIGPGDMLHIRVFNTPELEEAVRVTDAGSLRLLLGGELTVAGLTPAEAANAIELRLKNQKYVLDPHVVVTIEQFATQNVSVIGQVRSPGSISLVTPRSIVDVLAMTGGLTEAASRELTIHRKRTGEDIKYFVSNVPPDMLLNAPIVYPGDTVIVPHAAVVYVLGNVGRSGGYTNSTNDAKLSVLQLISMAGGAPPTAATGHTRLIRKLPDGTFTEMKIPLGDMQKGKKADIQLQADDILYVPFSYLKNVAVGVGGILTSVSSAAIYKF